MLLRGRRQLVLVLVAGLAACQPPASPPPAPALPLTILHTNDHHGHAWRSAGGGSLAARATLIKRVRAEVEGQGGQVLLLDAGDIHTGSFCSDALKAEPDLRGYGRLGYRAVALGNHEFDVPLDRLRAQAAALPFPLLAANVVRAEDGAPAFGDVARWDLGGARVVALGLAPWDTPQISTSGDDPRLRFLDPAAVAAARVPALRRQARVLIGLFHLGLADIDALVRRVPGIDVVVSGHDHRALAQPRMAGATPVVQAGADGRYLGRVDLVAPARGPVALRAARLYAVGPDLPEDPDEAAALARDRGRCGGGAVVGHAAAALGRDAPVAGRGSSTALANLVADAFRAATGADVAFINRGGIRTDLPAGDITRERVHDILPFEDTLIVLEATGAELQELAVENARRLHGASGLLYPAGAEIVARSGGRVEVRVGGKPVHPAARYTVAVSNFIGRGGDGFQIFPRLKRVRALPLSPAAALVDYLKQHSPVQPVLEPRLRME
ncbi:MAG TPA: 5'-nucleotidase C-terminal domain-containing protein [Polyangia bacterium]|jgi:5'-nucleotidase/UDP-sugar diphosphatase